MEGKEALRKRKRIITSDEQITETRRSEVNAALLKAVDNRAHLDVSKILESPHDCISQSAMNAAMFRAIDTGQKRILQLLIDHGSNINLKNTKGNTPLMTAAEHGYFDIVKVLVQHGANVNCQNKVGKTALMLAAENACSVSIIEFLISPRKGKADVNLQDKKGKTVLMNAIELCDFPAMEKLIYNKATDLTLKDVKGNNAFDIAKKNGVEGEFDILQACRTSKNFVTPVMLAVKKNDACLLRSFLYGCDNVDVTDIYGLTPLMLALGYTSDNYQRINLDVVSMLLEAGASVNVADIKTGVTPLMSTALQGCLAASKLFIERGADLNRQTKLEKNSALMIASMEGKKDVAELLINSAAELELTNCRGESALAIAFKYDNYEIAKLLIENGAKSNELTYRLAVEHGQHRLYPTVTENLATPEVIQALLAVGINRNNHDLVNYLLEKGASVNHLLEGNCFPLFLAAGDKNMAEIILNHGARINERNGSESYTALMQAVKLDNGEVVSLLINRGADMYIESEEMTALTMAIKLQEKGRSALEALLVGGMDVNYISPNSADGKLPLHISVTLSNSFSTAQLLCYGAYLNAQDNRGGTALMMALRYCPSDVPLLIEKGANINLQLKCGATAIMLATTFHRLDAIKSLLKNGADVNLSNARGETPLMKAAQCHTTDVIKLFLDYGAAVNAVDTCGSSVLLHAVAHSILRTNTVDLLIKRGAEVNRANNDGVTPLIIAAQKCGVSIVSHLIESGANLNAQDIYGSTPLIHAAACPEVSAEKVDFLIASGADLNHRTGQGQDALILATMKCNYNIVKRLITAGINMNAIETETHHNALYFAISNLNRCFRTSVPNNNNCLHCLKILLEGGAKLDSSEESLLFFHHLIIRNKKGLLQLFVNSGIAPPEVPVDAFYRAVSFTSYFTRVFASSNSVVTPLVAAILSKNPDIIQFFIKNWYLSKFDIHLNRNKVIRHIIQNLLEYYPDLNASVEDVILGPWSLASLSFVAVSTAVGKGFDREQRIKSLPIPHIWQQKLLFRNKCVVLPVIDDEADITGGLYPGLDGLDYRD